jgi:predicted SAM-dependent methyltransferase
MCGRMKELLPLTVRNRYRSQWMTGKLQCKIMLGKLGRIFFQPASPKTDSGEIYLHLGCGSTNHPKFINIDTIPAPHIHYIRSVDDLSIFEDNTVSLIYASHCLEHFSHTKISEVLTEWYRVLKNGGIIRLSVPDFDLILDIYNSNGREIHIIDQYLMGGQGDKYNYHKAVFNKISLTAVLKKVGFQQVREWQYGSCDLTTLGDWSGRTVTVNNKEYPISLNIEATK